MGNSMYHRFIENRNIMKRCRRCGHQEVERCGDMIYCGNCKWVFYVNMIAPPQNNSVVRKSQTLPTTLPRGCYVYLWYDEEKYLRYIGKGTGIRAWVQHSNLSSRYLLPHKVIIYKDGMTDDEALDLEVSLIKQLAPESPRLENKVFWKTGKRKRNNVNTI